MKPPFFHPLPYISRLTPHIAPRIKSYSPMAQKSQARGSEILYIRKLQACGFKYFFSSTPRGSAFCRSSTKLMLRKLAFVKC